MTRSVKPKRKHGTFPRGLALVLVYTVWSITPVSWAYVLTTLAVHLDVIPAPPQSLQRSIAANVVHWTLLLVALPEIPFSLYYRWLVFKIQKLRDPPKYSRKFLKGVLYRSLETGMNLDPSGRLSPSPTPSPSTPNPGTGRTFGGSNASDEDSDTVLVSPLSNSEHVSQPTTPGPSFSSSLSAPSAASSLRQRLNATTSSTNDTRPSFIREPIKPDDPRAIDFQKMQSKWFHLADWRDIKLENAYEWFSWSLFGQDLGEIMRERKEWEAQGRPENPEDEDWEKEIGLEGDKFGLVKYVVRLTEIRAGGIRLPSDRNADVRSVRLTLDPVKVTQRPLLAYIVMRLSNVALWRAIKRLGFEWEKDEHGIEYVIKKPKGWNAAEAEHDENKRPVLLLHGLGMGLSQYASLLHKLGTAPELENRPVLVLVQPHISMNIFHPRHLTPHTKEMAAGGLRRAIDKHGFDKSGLTVISHSNGTVVHGWLLKVIPEEIRRSCFVDPVCFCLWEPDVCYNFLYRKPRNGMEILLHYFVATEPGVALNLSRYFDWADCLLWYEEIPNPHSKYDTAFFLAGQDAILDSERVRRYLHGHGIEEVEEGGNMTIHRNAAHGEILIAGGEGVQQVMQWVEGKV